MFSSQKAGILINNSRFTKGDDIVNIVAALKQLPGPEIDTTTVVDPDAALIILQREQAYVNPAKNPLRFIGTKRLSDCIFVIFTITDATASKSYFTVHIDGNKSYNWESLFKTLTNCTVSATIIGGQPNRQTSIDNLHGLLTYLLTLTQKFNVDIKFEAQYVLDSFTPTLSDWPQDFTMRLRNKAQVLHRRLFGKDLPAELAQCAFTREMMDTAAEDKELAALLLKLHQDRKNQALQEMVQSKLMMEGLAMRISWVNFVDFIIDGDAIHHHMVDALLINARALATTPEHFAYLYKKLFSAMGFNAVQAAFTMIGSPPQVKANNFVYDTATQKIILINSHFPDGKYTLPRKLRITDLRARDYWEVYNPEAGYRFPAIHPQTLAYFRDMAPRFYDLPKGMSHEVIDGFLKGLMMGYGFAELGINITLETCWLAYHWSHAPAASLVAPPLPKKGAEVKEKSNQGFAFRFK